MEHINKLSLLVFCLICILHVNSQGSEHTSSEHEEGKPYAFAYAVKDDLGNDFGHNVESDGDVVKGEYRTLLPGGRIQTVKYQADWKNGYTAQVTYSGVANQIKTQEKQKKKSNVVAHAFFSRAGKQNCRDGAVGLNCNPETGIEDTKPQNDF